MWANYVRTVACSFVYILLAGCPGGGPAPLPTERAVARFPPGGVVDVIQVEALNRLPLRSAELVAPDGAATPSAAIAVNPAPAAAVSQWNPDGPFSGATFGVSNFAVNAPASGIVAGVPQSSNRILATLATTTIGLPDPVAYRRDWRGYHIRLRFGDPPGPFETREIAAPQPPPEG
jgi:hypothetical protein